MNQKQSRAVITLVLTFILLIPFLATPVNAAYENTYTNTGDMRNDIIGVALTQVGYEEGDNNYTKYGVWYGQPNSPWCGMFVSWCAKEAGVPTSVLKRTGIANPSNFGLSYKSGSEYTPQKGDLFFKKNFSHVGLVYYTEGSYFYTIEGNTSTTSYDGYAVMIRKRKISDFYFSSPDYSGSGSSATSGCDHSYTTKVESDHPHKEYKVCTKCGKTSYTGEKIANDTCKTCIQEKCSHTFQNWVNNTDSKHIRVCSKCGFQETGSHDWVEGNVIKEATCVENGSRQVVCSICNATSTKSIAATGKHEYGNYAYIDESVHQKVCNMCNEQTTSQHTFSNEWQHDGIYHWTTCSDCGGRIQTQEHRFENGCLEPCADCGYVSESGHKGNGERNYDESFHWEHCTRCNQDFDIASHIYTSACDETCNLCGYHRTADTAHTDEFHADETGHWRRCTSCERVTDIVSHSPAQNTEEWEALLCTHCGYELRSADRHVHTYDHVECNETTHWGTCKCGMAMGAEVHHWDFKTGKCTICGAVNTPAQTTHNSSFLSRIWNLIFN